MDTPALSKVTLVFMASGSRRGRASTRRQFCPGTPAAGGRFRPTHPGSLRRHTGCMSPANGSIELGAFLKARRAELAPREVGLPDHDLNRRVVGLRREEVAQLAAISVDYY